MVDEINMKRKKTLYFIIQIIKSIFRDDFPGMAAEMAFNLLLALFPVLICFISILGLFTDENIIGQIIKILTPFTPVNAINLIQGALKQIQNFSSGGLLTTSFLATVWLSTNGMWSMIKGLNRAYNVRETRPFLKVRALSLLMLIGMGVVIFLAVNFIVFGNVILKFIELLIHVPNNVSLTVLLVRWPISFLALYAMAYLVYCFAPNINVNKKIHSKAVVCGTLFFCIAWLLVSWGFGLYVENFGRYNQVYGTIGAVVVLLVWLYQTSLMILIGGEINSQIYKLLLCMENEKQEPKYTCGILN